ncbi:MAG: exosome complex exonuclease Rrp41 [Candidatus Aenigmarchaeota archaeon]|nr:exosome complex exonuclease Rrp41 [Candidatus Aenigmarchaeota archaeon]MCX8190731.1 exosome complex exonuclease Rrp41 [Candidatus Aenigmarchaeota archaeon]MDW8159979.1 exosome complex exonuclease Rrp41 [Candidatus Aenigmarchaeota archaeon]
MGKKTNIQLMVDGRRIDGRLPEQLREIEMKIGEIENADGSARVRFGNTEALVAVYGPRSLFPKFLQESDMAILRVVYSMAPFSVDERKNPAPDRRSIEISKVTKDALSGAVFLEEFPRTVIDVYEYIIQADGSTRVTAINAASLALASAGIPMKDLVAACSVGKIGDVLIVDLCGKEDNYSESDMAVAMMPSKGLITLLQMDGRLTKEEVLQLLKKAEENCKKIYEMQKKALLEKFKVVGED